MKQKHTQTIAKKLFILIGSVFICNLTACSNSSHLLLYQQSNLGLNAGINPSTQNLHVRVGLRRQFGAIVPKYALVETDDSGKVTTTNKAASAYFGSRARITSPFRVPEVAEVMATGRAAVIAAQSGNALNFTTKAPAANPEAVGSNEDNPTPPANPIASEDQTGDTDGAN